MTKLTADLQFSVSQNSTSDTASNAFDLVEEPEDQTYLRKAVFRPFLNWRNLVSSGDGKYGEALPLARYGVINLRMYCDESIKPTLTALDPITQQEQLIFGLGFSIVALGSSGYRGQQIESAGRTRAWLTERIQFNGTNSASLRYTYDTGAVSILYQTDFVDESGAPADAPILKSNGEFVANNNIYGALTVRYQPSFWRYRVFYDLSGFGVDFEVRGFYVGVKDRRNPPLPIFARHGTLSDLKSFSRDVEDWDFSQLNTGNDDYAGVEQSGETESETVRVTNPNDIDDYVDVQRPKKLVFKDKKGRKLELELVS